MKTRMMMVMLISVVQVLFFVGDAEARVIETIHGEFVLSCKYKSGIAKQFVRRGDKVLYEDRVNAKQCEFGGILQSPWQIQVYFLFKTGIYRYRKETVSFEIVMLFEENESVYTCATRGNVAWCFMKNVVLTELSGILVWDKVRAHWFLLEYSLDNCPLRSEPSFFAVMVRVIHCQNDVRVKFDMSRFTFSVSR